MPAPATAATTPAAAPPKRICCACPETRKPRDECVMMHGEESCFRACTIITYICLLPLRPMIPLIATSGQEHSVSAERCSKRD